MRLNKKGFTLVELVIGLFVLGAAGTMLVSTFSTSTNIINRATLFKNESSSAASSVELGEEVDSLTPGTYTVEFEQIINPIVITYTNSSGNEVIRTVYGQYYYGVSDSEKKSAHVKYKEFLPDVLYYEPPESP